jgi:hypothetical protein
MPLGSVKKKIIQDCDGDLWEQVDGADLYKCRTSEEADDLTYDQLWDVWAPLTVFRELE